MGQKLAGECGCQENGLFGLCAPQDPNKGDNKELTAPPSATSYPQVNNESVAGAPVPAEIGGGPAWQEHREEEQAFFLPPPDDQIDPSQVPAPMGGEVAPPQSTAPLAAPAQSDVAVTFEMVVFGDIDSVERAYYGNVFTTLAGGTSVPVDNAQVMSYLNERISADEGVAAAVQRAAAQTDMPHMLTQEMFIMLLQQYAVSDTELLTQFFNMVTEGADNVPSYEIRSGLMAFCQEKVHVNLTDARWDNILDNQLESASIEVTSEQWSNMARNTIRMLRIVRDASL
jgi:hypothetical protein